MKKLLTLPEVAERLACSVPTVRGHLKRDLPFVRVGNGQGGIRVDEADLEAWIEKRKETGTTKVPAPNPVKLKNLSLR